MCSNFKNQHDFIRRTKGFTEEKCCADKISYTLKDYHRSKLQNPDEAVNETNIKNQRLRSIVDVLPTTDKETRLRWSNELILKLVLLQKHFVNEDYNISLDCLKIDLDENLVIDIIGLNFRSSISEVYKAPEQFVSKNVDAEKSNIWSAGICVYFITSLSFPWKKASLSDIFFRRWVKDRVFNNVLEDSTVKALNSMLTVDVKQRPCMKEVVRDLSRKNQNSSIISKLRLFYNY